MSNRFPPDLPFLAFWVSLLVLGFFLGRAHIPVRVDWHILLLASVNVSTFFLYGLDKLLAVAGTRRVPERTLQFSALLLGSPGALVAMWLFRHKTRKTSFQLVLALLVLAQVAVLAWMASRPTADLTVLPFFR